MTTRHAIELLDAAAASSPERVFLRGEQAMTFNELATASHAIAAWLRARGLRAGDCLLIATSNSAESIAVAFGAARCGVTFGFLHHTISRANFRYIIEQVDPACVVLDSATLELQSDIRNLPLLAAGVSVIDGATPVADLLAAGHAQPIESLRCDPLCLVFTSGSTGEPRGVMVSHDNVNFTVSAIQERLRYQAEDVIGLYLPLSFDYGLYQLFLALAVRASVYLGAPDLVPLRLVTDLVEHRITVLPGVPSLFSSLVQMLKRRPRELPRLRAVTNTGEHLPAVTIDLLRALVPRLDIFLMYGLTECKRVSILLPGELETHPGSVGRPLDGTTAEVIGSDGNVAADDTPGELVVRGPHLTMGYWRAPEETARQFRVGADGARSLFTGDTCRRSTDGYLYFEGRNDAQTKRNGFRVSLLEIESAALAISGTTAAAAIVQPHSNELHLFLSSSDSTISTDAVLRELRVQLEPYKIPDRIHVLASLPMAPNSKIDRQRLFALAAGTTR